MTTLNSTYVDNDIKERSFSEQLANLAVQLAQQDGEEVKRPLSKDQLARALSVNTEETTLIMGLLWEGYEKANESGNLPAEAYPLKIDA